MKQRDSLGESRSERKARVEREGGERQSVRVRVIEIRACVVKEEATERESCM